jgi:hypothetical protein
MTNTWLTDKGLSVLGSLPKLEHLSINSNAGITDAGLASLHRCNTLRHLNVCKTKVTAGGVALLHEKLPLCDIAWDNGAFKPVLKRSDTPQVGK